MLALVGKHANFEKVNLRSLILYELPVLSLEDSGQKALSLMRDFHVYHLPVVHRDDYMALVSEEDLLDWDHVDEALGKAEFLTFRPAVFEDMHPIEAVKLIKEFGLSLIPVLDSERNYLGCATMETLFNFVTDTNIYNEEGGIIVLQVSPIDFSMAEIARLAESNNITLYGLVVHRHKTENKLIITLKTNKKDLDSLVATYERYEYEILNVYNAFERKDSMKENYDLFMRYLNM